MSATILTAIITASVAFVIGILNYFHNQRILKEQRRADRRKSIVKKLNEFYGPLVSYLNVVKALYRIFSANKPEEFRTLSYLLNPKQEYNSDNGNITITLTDSDYKLLNEIIEVERQIEILIIQKAGLIDDDTLMFDDCNDPLKKDPQVEKLSLLSVAVTHFRVLRLAAEGHFLGENERFTDFEYPKDLDNKLQERIDELKQELAELTN